MAALMNGESLAIEAQNALTELKATLTVNWNGTEKAIQRLTQTLAEQTFQIRTLGEIIGKVEKEKEEKERPFSTMTAKSEDIQREHDGQKKHIPLLVTKILALEKQVAVMEGNNKKLTSQMNTEKGNTEYVNREKNQVETKYQEAMTDVETLRGKLAEAEQRIIEAMEVSLGKELENRTSKCMLPIFWQTVASAAESVTVKAYTASQIRIKALEAERQVQAGTPANITIMRHLHYLLGLIMHRSQFEVGHRLLPLVL
ncbi:hypothetical protein BU17DRAFT_65641 [Hysterangium stoloniferum]|nr:hypothetical protein BU17DRAFT_65641 [Hysterangium stoloniferum]